MPEDKALFNLYKSRLTGVVSVRRSCWFGRHASRRSKRRDIFHFSTERSRDTWDRQNPLRDQGKRNIVECLPHGLHEQPSAERGKNWRSAAPAFNQILRLMPDGYRQWHIPLRCAPCCLKHSFSLGTLNLCPELLTLTHEALVPLVFADDSVLRNPRSEALQQRVEGFPLAQAYLHPLITPIPPPAAASPSSGPVASRTHAHSIL